MIYLSAQPDTEYFLWQIEVLILNLKNMGIQKDDIHVLVSFNKNDGVNKNFLRLAKKYSTDAGIFFYPDNRIRHTYISTIRPHIISQHFEKFPFLSKKAIFYHDSDIVFTTSLPKSIKQMEEDDIVYMSDTSSYLNIAYINSRGKNILNEMTSIIGISVDTVIQNDNNAGGAQVILKKVDHKFWHKIEDDSHNLFCYLKSNESRHQAEFEKENPGIKAKLVSSWCADMWAMLWNCFLNFEVKVHPELAFCWPHESRNSWNERYIFHNAGVDQSEKRRCFFKTDYYNYSPYNEDLSFVVQDSCSSIYTDLVKAAYCKPSYLLENTTFFLFGDIQDSLTERYIRQFYNGPIYILDNMEVLNKALFQKVETDTITFYNANYIVDPSKLDAIQNVSRNKVCTCVGYEIQLLPQSVVNKFNHSLDYSFLSKYCSLDNINFLHRYSALCIEITSLENLIDKTNITPYNSFLRDLTNEMDLNYKIKNIDQNITLNYRVM